MNCKCALGSFCFSAKGQIANCPNRSIVASLATVCRRPFLTASKLARSGPTSDKVVGNLIFETFKLLLFRLSSECVQIVFKLCSECVQSVVRMCSECSQNVVRI